MGWWQEHKEVERQQYGNYCVKVRKEGKEPLPFHVWQQAHEK